LGTAYSFLVSFPLYMLRFYPFAVLLLGLLVASYTASAQQGSPTISGDFRNLRFEQFAQRVEAQTPYRFYFDPAMLDGTPATI
jgi:hypothetical protein